MIHFRQYVPATVANWVKSIWYMEVGKGLSVYEELIPPDGHHELIFYLEDYRSRRLAERDEWIEQPGTLIATQTLESYRMQMQAGARLYGVRFYPHTLYPLLRVPLHELGSAVLPMDELLRGRGLEACIDEDVEAT